MYISTFFDFKKFTHPGADPGVEHDSPWGAVGSQAPMGSRAITRGLPRAEAAELEECIWVFGGLGYLFCFHPMDNVDLYKVDSMRQNGNSMWSSNTLEDVFSQSSRHEDDEEALKWAAFEKLPTYNRLRKGILSGVDGGELKEVNIMDLGYHERKNLLERLIKVGEEDLENFLLKLKNRIERVGIELPTIEVRFEHLSIEAEAYVGSRGLPTVINFTFNILEGILNTLHILPNQKKPISILHDVSGIIKPHRMTLLLGPPGSGKTSLLLALAGKLDKDLKVEIYYFYFFPYLCIGECSL
ncbi:pleiotropic drug resistance protein 1-like protein [Cinnamomum micranthum f. kanehirae]|uniref:Pleiotropic drug resistance protein 1-like protein n=1 Tax=Cinnamomum micranthum f. kanehirae TaxID=337451 RepID=A0A443NXZ1_9MAGN|nr:pleiotropic drug resistance protein 1-like protein [Cinnamomum micranthum f. kanehirae]